MRAFSFSTCKLLALGLAAASVVAAKPAKPVLGFFAQWNPPSPVYYDKLTHILYAFALPGGDGSLTDQGPPPASMVSSAHAAGLKVLISVGGANHSTTFASFAASAAGRSKFASSAKQYCDTYALDGVDVDWEYPLNAQDSANFTLLLQALRTAIGTTRLITADVAPTNEKGMWVSKSAFQYLDFVNTMAYDFTGSFPGSLTGQHSSYNHGILAATYWKSRGVERKKVVMGVPFYGKSFPGGAAVDYKQIVASNPNLSPDADSIGQTWFNGPTTIKKKATFIGNQEMGGIMIWQMAQDASPGAKSLLDAIQVGIAAPSFVFAPGGDNPKASPHNAQGSPGRILLSLSGERLPLYRRDARGRLVRAAPAAAARPGAAGAYFLALEAPR